MSVLKIKPLYPSFKAPSCAHDGDALDLFAHGGESRGLAILGCLSVDSKKELEPVGTIIPRGRQVLIDAGFSMALPEGHRALICSRSGLAAKFEVSVGNPVGVIDTGYRGPIKVLLRNNSKQDVFIPNGFAIGQMLVQKIDVVEMSILAEGEGLDETSRGANGFGSTDGRK